jgi:hypothetical protein
VRPKVYLETTIAGYLTAWPSRDLITAARQQITRTWWEERREEFDLFVSQIVVQEAGAGDEGAARRRLEALDGIPMLEIAEPAYDLAERLMSDVPLPEQAAVDALHVSVSVVSGMEYLLTWNCKHIANAILRGRIEAVCRANGYEPPTICTPEEFLEE